VPNEINGNEFVYYNWIYLLEISYTKKTLLAEIVSPRIGKEWELPKLPSSADIRGE